MYDLLNVFRRELQRMTSRHIYFVACVVLPLFSVVFMATIFGNGQMQNLPVGVVDGDNTSLSRNIIRMVDATPELAVIHHYANEMEAQNAIKRKEIYGFLDIPMGFMYGVESFCFFLMGIAFIILVAQDVKKLMKGDSK